MAEGWGFGEQGTYFSLTGQSEVLQNLNRAIRDVASASTAAMRTATLVVRRNTLPITPVDIGTLRGSWYAEVYKDEWGTAAAEIGFWATYAPYVHEINKAYKSPGTQWKFLERGLRESWADILSVLQGGLAKSLQPSARRDGGGAPMGVFTGEVAEP